MRKSRYTLEAKVDSDSTMPICDIDGKTGSIEDHAFMYLPIVFGSEHIKFGLRDLNLDKILFMAQLSLKQLYEQISSSQFQHDAAL